MILVENRTKTLYVQICSSILHFAVNQIRIVYSENKKNLTHTYFSANTRAETLPNIDYSGL
jgi:hypothetical protein